MFRKNWKEPFNISKIIIAMENNKLQCHYNKIISGRFSPSYKGCLVPAQKRTKIIINLNEDKLNVYMQVVSVCAFISYLILFLLNIQLTCI